VSAEILDLRAYRARFALEKFGPQDYRPIAVDTLYGPSPQLGMAEMEALKSMGFAEVRKLSARRKEFRVTLTAAGRFYRDLRKQKAK
jgi:hypothetical protein